MNEIKNIQKTWDFRQFFKGDSDPKIKIATKQLESLVNRFANKWKVREDFLTKPQALREALDDYEKLLKNGGTLGKVGYYLWLRRNQDSQDKNLKMQSNKYDETERALANKIHFFELKLGKIDKARQKLFLNNKQLQSYRYFLLKIFKNSKYQLSEAEEKILTLKSGPAYRDWVNMLEEFIKSEERVILGENGKKSKKSFDEILQHTQSQKKSVRDYAAKEFNEVLEKYSELAEHEINAIFSDKKINDELRGLPLPESSRYVADEISPNTVELLAKSVTKKFDLPIRYYKLKAKLLNKKRLAYHERSLEYGTLNKKYSLKEAYKIVNKTFYGLDPEFSRIFLWLINEGRIDVFPKKGKQAGAFASYGVAEPTYILLNFANKLRDLTTIAHECGHAINGEMMRTIKNSLDYGGTIATAEVASTFMEDFVLNEIMKEADDKTRLSIMMSRLSDDMATIFRQIACHNFQLELHNKFRQDGYVTKKVIGALFVKHMRSYMGPAVEQSKGSENWWVYWGHLRTYFYNYQYASGLLISKAMQNAVKSEPSYIKK